MRVEGLAIALRPRSPGEACDLGAAIFAAGELAPADRKIYALRDVTAHPPRFQFGPHGVAQRGHRRDDRALVLHADGVDRAVAFLRLDTADGCHSLSHACRWGAVVLGASRIAAST